MYFLFSHSISIPIVSGCIIKKFNHIIRIEARSNYCRIYCADEQHPITVAKVLSWFQQMLPAQLFIRTHRTHLVNIQFIKNKTDNQGQLKNGEWISISRRRKNEVKEIAL